MIKTKPEVEIACMTRVKSTNQSKENGLIWHKKFGHPSYENMKRMKELKETSVYQKKNAKSAF